MKYTETVTINESRENVIKTLRNVEESFQWMEGLTKFELLSGENEAVGSKYIMEFNQKGKVSRMTETIEAFDPPSKMVMIYEAGGVWNKTINTFEDNGDKTVYHMDNVFKFKFPLILFLPLFKKLFRKETRKGMDALKNHIESKKE